MAIGTTADTNEDREGFIAEQINEHGPRRVKIRYGYDGEGNISHTSFLCAGHRLGRAEGYYPSVETFLQEQGVAIEFSGLPS